MAQGKKEEAEEVKKQVAETSARLKELEALEPELKEKVKKIMMIIPNIIDPSVPIGKDDSENVEVQKYGEPVVPDFEIPYHADIMEALGGIDLDSARKVAGNGFYYLMGDIARLHSAIISYARDFMIDRGFTYCIPPFMIRSNVVTGVMSFAEMDAMMYKIEGEDLYLIGTSEHSMIGKFIDTIIPEDELPKTLTSYSPCFRKEKGAHGIEERGVYRIHQFEKQEMIVVCKPEDSKMWFDKLWQNTVDLFRSMDIPVRTLECCSGDLADLKVKSVDVEAWSPRQKKYFEVGSCSNLGDAQARRLQIRVKGEDGKKYLAHTSGVKASIIEAVNVFVAIIVSGFIFHQENVTAKKMLGCLVGFAGVVLINMNGMNFHMSLSGEGAIFLSTVAYAFSSVFLKRYSVKHNPVMLSGYQFIVGGIILSAAGFAMGGRLSTVSTGGVLMLIYLALVSAVAYSLWGMLLKYNPISRVAVFGFMNPVFGVILSAWLLREGAQALGPVSLVSLVLVCTGIYIVNSRERSEKD